MKNNQAQEKTFQSKIKENHRRNFIFNLASSSANDIASQLIGQKTILPAFLTLFTQSNIIIGMLPAIHIFFWTSPQLLTSYYTGHLRKKKDAIILLRTGKAFPWLLFAVYILIFTKTPSQVVFLPFFLIVALFAFQGGFVIPLWTSFISKLTHSHLRGRFFALRHVISTALGVLASLKIKQILVDYQYPVNFSIIFISAFFMFLLSAIFLTQSIEPLSPNQIEKKSLKQYLKHLKSTTRDDKIFKWFIISIVIRSFGCQAMGGAFYTVYAINELHISIDQAGTFMGILLGVRLLSALPMGYISDKKTPKLIQIINRIFEITSLAVILLFFNTTGIYIAFGFLGLAMSSMMISYHNTVIELAPKEKVDIYLGLVNGIRAPSLAISPVIGGLLVDTFSYQLVFVIAIICSALSCIVFVTKVYFSGYNHKINK